MEDQMPLVSVLMTAYNREEFIKEAIESVLKSTYKNFELIIVDDNSQDQTFLIALNFQEKDERIKVYKNESNLGDYPNRNKAAGYANGKYLKYLDSDDLIYPWGLEAMVHCMERFPEAGFGLMAQNFSTQKPLPVCLLPHATYLNFYFKGRLITMGPTGAIIKAEAFRESGGFSGTQYVGDTELWFKLGSRYPLVCMPTELVWWRQHAGQQIKDESRITEIKYQRFLINREPLYSVDCPLSLEERTMASKNIEKLYYRNLILEFAKGNIKQAYILKKHSKVSFFKLLSSIKKNEYPDSIKNES